MFSKYFIELTDREGNKFPLQWKHIYYLDETEKYTKVYSVYVEAAPVMVLEKAKDIAKLIDATNKTK